MLWWQEIDKPWKHQTKTSALLQKVISRSYILHCRNKTHKEIIVGHLASIRLGLVQVLCKNLAKCIAAVETKPKNSFQDHQLNIDSKILSRKQRSKSESYSDHSSGSSRGKPEKTQSETDQQTTTSNDTGMSPLSRAPTKKDASQNLTPFKNLGSRNMLSSFKTLVFESHETKSQIYGPCDEASLVISDPQTAKLAPLLKEQPVKVKGPPPKGLIFNPIYIESGSKSIESARDLQVLFPNCFKLHWWYVRRIWHQNRHDSPTSSTQKT